MTLAQRIWAVATRNWVSWIGHGVGMILAYQFVVDRDANAAFFAYLLYEIGGQWIPKAIAKQEQDWLDNFGDLVVGGFMLAVWVILTERGIV